MRLTREVYVVGGGHFGFGLSGRNDCHVYVLDGGSELALMDPGLGLGDDFSTILDNMRADGLDPRRVRKLILTHYHCDHIGAAAEAEQRLNPKVYASAFAAPVIREAEEHAVALDVARKAGLYPADYRLPPCPVHHELREGDVVEVGDLRLTAYETPGHCDGHLSFLMDGGDRRCLLGADLVFWGGTVLLQNIHDCRIDAYADSVYKVAALDFDALLPGHMNVALSDGKTHVTRAAEIFRTLAVPPNLV